MRVGGHKCTDLWKFLGKLERGVSSHCMHVCKYILVQTLTQRMPPLRATPTEALGVRTGQGSVVPYKGGNVETPCLEAGDTLNAQ